VTPAHRYVTDPVTDASVPVAFVPQAEHGLPGQLGFAPAPGRWRFCEEGREGEAIDDDLRSLRRACGASVLVTLLERKEMARLGLADLIERTRRSGLECEWLPIPDGAPPADLEAASRLVAWMVERLAAGRTVVVHCHGGIGRSGTIAACVLVATGAEPGRAIEVVRAARAGAATGPGQEAFVHEFAKAWRRDGGA
jgi:protein-tyrosine phosphatase